MANLADLIAQKAALEQKIAEARRAERAGAIAQIKSLMAAHGLTLADLAGKASTAAPAKKGGARKGSKVPAKYRDPSRPFSSAVTATNITDRFVLTPEVLSSRAISIIDATPDASSIAPL